MWKIVLWEKSALAPCTPTWVMELFSKYDIKLSWKNAVVIGRSNIVGKPMANMLINAWATVTVCNSRTKDIKSFTKNADIVIIAIGKPEFLTLDMINDNTTVIDVWFTVVDGKIYGDAKYNEIEANGNAITPVPGGVWPMTVACLMKNVIKAWNEK
jgi:methylenetetrahydrofolate dehydrogenase (NADP+)/methenyltetrahydrofolate cyclohydrolase